MKHLLIALVVGATLAIAIAPSAAATGGCEESEAGCPNEGVADSGLKNVERRPGGVYVEGWARDPDTTAPIDAAILIDGVEVATVTADEYYASWYLTGYHGFSDIVPARPGSQVCVQPIEFGGQPWEVGLGDCKQVTVSVNPTGAFESVTAVGSSLRVTGWVIDPDTAAAIDVRVTILDDTGPHVAGQMAANVPRNDLARPAYGDNHGFDGTIPRPARATAVCVDAVNAGAGADVRLGCKPIAPTLTITSVGLTPNLNVSSSDSAPASASATRTADVLLLATAHDWNSGVKNVRLTGESIVTCVSGDGVVRELRSPIAAANPYLDPAATGGPTTRAVQYGFNVLALLRTCGPGTSWSSLRVEVTGRVDSFNGAAAATPLATIRHLVLKVATFNVSQGAVRATDDPDAILARWGRELFARADIVLVTELWDEHMAAVLAANAGLPHSYLAAMYLYDPYRDVAVFSRFPLRDALTEPLFIQSGWRAMVRTKLLGVTADIAGVPHRLLVSHWAPPEFPWQPDPHRLAAASVVNQRVDEADGPVFFGGDLNACPPAKATMEIPECSYEGEALDAPGDEWHQIVTRLTDSFSAAPGEPRHCSDTRIDYVFFRGSYRVTGYESCLADAEGNELGSPSDHPWVLATLEHT
jgi:endonuclease/exonuclease/phosphatase (EEP) superfamily protein YafD